MAKSSGPWYANLKTNQIVALVAAGIVVTLIVLQVFGFDLWSRFGKSDNFIPSFIDGGGDTDPASLLNVDEELVGNLSESIVAEQPVSYMSPEEITHGDMLLGILAEGYVMAAEEIASSRLETMMNRVMVSGTALPPGQFVNTLDDKLAYAIMKDLGGEASEDATKAAVKKPQRFSEILN
ncbi:putative membrane protein [Emiliania huxleyi virus 164]|nr:putative membrane protein [Emiliania huxleyi virus 164]